MTASQAHQELLAALKAAGHNVSLWRSDPSNLRAYAEAVGFDPAAYAISERKFAADLAGVIERGLDDVMSASSFADRGLIADGTHAHDGVVVRLADGRVFNLSITRER